MGASIQSTATKVTYLNYPSPGFRLLQPKRNKSHKQGNSPTKPIDRLQKSLYNSSVLTYFILRVKNGGEDHVEDIKKANDMGVICGVTTNPSLIAKEGRDFNEVIKEIASIVDGPISGEVKATTTDAEGMIKEGREIAAIHPNMVVKIPMTVEGLKACKVLSQEGIKTNLTLIFTANQALLAARAGATYVSPFLGRLDDISVRGIDLIRDIAEIFAVAGLDTEIIAASVRNPIHVTDCALAGADIATVPYKVIEQMTKHPLTDAGIEKFKKDYIAVFGE